MLVINITTLICLLLLAFVAGTVTPTVAKNAIRRNNRARRLK